MKILSIIKLAQEAGYIKEGTRNLLGAIENARSFEENFAALDQLHRGAYAFFAFHPISDPQVAEYIGEGSLGDDAGPHILALFLNASSPPQTPRTLQPGDALFGVSVSREEHPAYEFVSQFFPKEARPRLPGLVIFDRLFKPDHSIYIPLDGQDKAHIKVDCRAIFELVNRSAATIVDERNKYVWRLDFDRLAAHLVELDVPYWRTGEKGIRAAAFIAGIWIKKNASAIVAAIPKLVSFVAKTKTGGVAP